MRYLVLCTIAALVVGLSVGYGVMAKISNDSSQSKTQTIHGFDASNLDRSANACHDFYQFADGGWMSKNPIPAAYPTWGSFNQLADKNQEVLHKILDDASHNTTAKKGTTEQKIGDFYASCMDTAEIEKAGTKPLDPEFAAIEKINNLQSLMDEVARLHTIRVNAMFFFGAGQDVKDSTKVIGQLGQGGLGLPERDYYTRTDERSKHIRDEYVKHVAKMLELLGDAPDKAAAEANAVMAIETKLAESSQTAIQRRDPNSQYHMYSQAQLSDLTKNINWTEYFKDIHHPQTGSINVGQPDFFKNLDSYLTSIPLADWKAYLRWHLIDAAAGALPEKFEAEDFNFKGKVLSGTTEELPRWKRCVGTTDRRLGEALGKEYVENTFTPETKAHAKQMVENLIAALKEDLSTLSWMSDATRKNAIIKLEAFTKKIGYPDKWRDYSALNVDRGPFIDDILRSSQFDFNRNLSEIGKPVDKTQWGMTPPTVNAYYSPQRNEIVFPAGILQPPFYDPKADDAVNYGGMGAVIGHEMTHGFDDQGSQFDAEGNLKNWWTPEDKKNFDARAKCVETQFDSFVVNGNLHEKGKLVLGESIADLGGLTISYKAFEKSLEGKPRPKNIDGFTPEQRFFLGWAQVWASNIRPEYAEVMVNTNPHPLARFRVNGPLSNMPAFAEAFGCKTGDEMVRPPDQRCVIW